MKKIYWLNGLINILWLISMVSIPFIILFIGAIAFVPNEELSGFEIEINGNDVLAFGWAGKAYLIFNGLVYLAFVYVIYLFRALVRQFLKARLFDEKVIDNFNKIGWILVVSGLSLMIFSFIYGIYYRQNISIGLNISLGNGNLALLIMGLFFRVLSEVFSVSKRLQTENDLTI
ncbi:MAG: hypothetical protein CSA38_05280 [Flavobacteriales bacterium]|nr:MAG: hypothetical protein CSA38_05280 [Flavobacteriales bacterium]